MKVRDYEQFVVESAFMGLEDDQYNVIGLCGEAGEVAEWVKKVVCRKKPDALTEEHLKKELGDVLHYVTRLALKRGWGLKDLMKCNVEKLEDRHGVKG